MSVEEAQKRWRSQHMDLVRRWDRDRRNRNIEKYRARQRASYARNAGRLAREARERRASDREGYNASVRERRAKHPEKSRAAVANRRAFLAGGTLSAVDILKQLRAQGRRCYYCFCALIGNRWQIDHFISIANGGRHEPGNIVMACRNCNLRKNKLNGMEFIRKINNERWYGHA